MSRLQSPPPPISSPKTFRPSSTSVNKPARSTIKYVSADVGVDARQLIPDAKSLKNKIMTDDRTARDLLRNIYAAEKSIDKITPTEQALNTFLRLKNDLRVLKIFTNKNLEKNFQNQEKIGIGLNSNEIIHTTVASAIGDDLESHFKNVQSYLENRDKTLFHICASVMEQCGHSTQCELQPLPSLCTPNMMNLFSIFLSYIQLNNRVKELELMTTGTESSRMAAWKEQLEITRAELLTATEDNRKLKARYEALSSDGRNQTIVRQQRIIDSLEEERKYLNNQLESMKTERKIQAQEELCLRDDLLQAQAHLETLRAAYEADIVAIKPTVEYQVRQSDIDKKSITTLQTNIDLCANRFTLSEKRFEALQAELDALRLEKVKWERESRNEQRKFADLKAAHDRAVKISKVIMAAKLDFEEKLKESERLVEKKDKEINEISFTVLQRDSTISSLKADIEALKEQLLESKEKTLKDEEKINQLIAEMAAQELVIKDCRTRTALIEEAGMSETKKLEWDNMCNQLQAAQNQTRHLKKELSQANRKLYELQVEYDKYKDMHE